MGIDPLYDIETAVKLTGGPTYSKDWHSDCLLRTRVKYFKYLILK